MFTHGLCDSELGMNSIIIFAIVQCDLFTERFTNVGNNTSEFIWGTIYNDPFIILQIRGKLLCNGFVLRVFIKNHSPICMWLVIVLIYLNGRYIG